MYARLNELSVAVIGGDARETEVVRVLTAEGIAVTAIHVPGTRAMPKVKIVDDLKEGVRGKPVIVGPVQGVDDAGFIKVSGGQGPLRITHEVMEVVPKGSLFFIGHARPLLREITSAHGIKLIEILERDDFAIYNSIPTAEGAIQVAMEQMPITLFGSRAFVLGYGRVGQTLARRLAALGAQTFVVARTDADLARAFEEGLIPVEFQELKDVIFKADVIFNTVPALVLDKEVLSLLSRDTLILDLASAPGGVDFDAAKLIGIKAMLLPGLPGNVAPKTAGRMVAELVIKLVKRELLSCLS